MTRSHQVLGLLLAALVGVYGCHRAAGGSADGGRLAQLEAKVQRLEEDFRATAAARDAARKQLAATQAELAQARKQLTEATAAAAGLRQEREEAAAALAARTAERDGVQAQYDAFRRSLRDMLGQAEAAAAPAPMAPPTDAAPAPRTVEAAVRN